MMDAPRVAILAASLDRAEVYRYMGCTPEHAPEAIQREVARLLSELETLAVPRHRCADFLLERTPDGIRLAGTTLVLPGADIAALLADCDSCMLMAATLGMEMDRAIDAAQRRSISEGVALDAIANALIEAYCDALQAGRKATARYSPGYGDLPLALQPCLLAVLDAPRRIGLLATASHLLTPRKSVTAVVGLHPAARVPNVCAARAPDACVRCALAEDCILRKAGKRCGV